MVTKHIREVSSGVLNHEIPIIAMTANSMEGDYEKCIESGIDDYVAKQFIIDKLAKVIEKWIPTNSH